MNQLVLVHHANQYLITDGYDNRDGISAILDGYERVLDLHEHFNVPAGLHLSGTLLEAIAWHRPPFLHRVRDLVDANLLTLIGGTYADNVMSCFAPEFNRLQLLECFDVHRRLLACEPSELSTFWVPERVWTEAIADVITDPTLPNTGYTSVLLDDRLLFDPGRARRGFDATGPYRGETPHPPTLDPGDRRFAIAERLDMFPISAQLRYRIPPRDERDLGWIETALASRDDALLVYADDLEKTAGVGGWANDVDAYRQFLEWVGQREDLQPVHPREVPAADTHRSVATGTFYELAHNWDAGEDYTGWSESPLWAPYQRLLGLALDEIVAAEKEGAEGKLVTLARKHHLASAHETAWHDDVDGRRAPAPWVRTIASHVRAVRPILLAARTMPATEKPVAYQVDLDADGIEEVVLSVAGAMCVLAPSFGARLIYLFHDTIDSAAMSVGNPTDHFNFQEELNRFMDQPPNHPGALVDVGHEHANYALSAVKTSGDLAVAVLTGPAVTKTVALSTEPSGVVVCYRGRATVEMGLSPDYLQLLRRGWSALQPSQGSRWRAVGAGDASIWITMPEHEARWAVPRWPVAGHCINFAIESSLDHWHLGLGWGRVDDSVATNLMRTVELLHD